jgi:hypothetical protein
MLHQTLQYKNEIQEDHFIPCRIKVPTHSHLHSLLLLLHLSIKLLLKDWQQLLQLQEGALRFKGTEEVLSIEIKEETIPF